MNDASPGTPEPSIPRKARDEVQLVVGQIHGVVSLAVEEIDRWLESPTSGDQDAPDITADDIRRAAKEVHAHFGTVHAALNTGSYDKALVRAGLTGAQGSAKRKGLVSRISAFARDVAERGRNYVSRLRGGLRWSGTFMGSLTTALQKEIERVPGAGAACEAIREFIELLLNATEPAEGGEQPSAPQRKRQPPADNEG